MHSSELHVLAHPYRILSKQLKNFYYFWRLSRHPVGLLNCLKPGETDSVFVRGAKDIPHLICVPVELGGKVGLSNHFLMCRT